MIAAAAPLRGQPAWSAPTRPRSRTTAAAVQRIVVRNGLTMDLADILLDDIADSVRYLEGLDRPLPREGRKTAAFHH